MSDLSFLDQHHAFYGTAPESEPEQPKDERAEKRDYERGVLVRTFTLQEGGVALELLTRLANMPQYQPINESDPLRADRALWYREGRQDLIREINAIIRPKEEIK